MSRKLVNGVETAVAFAVVIGLAVPRVARADTFSQTNLVSDVPGLAATTDPNLKNPWGVAFSLTSPFWSLQSGFGNFDPI